MHKLSKEVRHEEKLSELLNDLYEASTEEVKSMRARDRP